MSDDITQDTPQDPPEVTDPTGDEEAFSAGYVRGLRKEAAEYRVRAKLTDTANDRLLSAYVAADGRLIDPDLITVTEDILGDDGIVDADKVAASIEALLTAKPQYRKVKPAVIPQGVREEAQSQRGLFTMLRESR